MAVSDQIEIRSEEVQEIFGQAPSWILRWGMTLIFSIIAALILGSWIIKYPERVSARVTVTTAVPPARLMSQASGRVTFFVKDNQQVSKGDYLAVIENPAKTEDAMQLINKLGIWRNDIILSPLQINKYLHENLLLGQAQNEYVQFHKALRDYNHYDQLRPYEKQMHSIQSRIAYYELLNKQLIKQNNLLGEELGISEKRLIADSLLENEKMIAVFDFYSTKTSYLKTKQSYEKNHSEIIQNDIQISQLRSMITELELDKMEKENSLKSAIQDAFKNMETQLLVWEQHYILKAPVSGKVAFTSYWSNNHYVETDKEVFTIVPESQEIFGELLLPIIGSGKVEAGQRVNIKLDNYPAHEYGQISGRVVAVSLVPKDNMYTIRVHFPEGLTSSYKRQLEFKQEMQGSAEIITNDLRIIERIFNKFRHLSDKTS